MKKTIIIIGVVLLLCFFLYIQKNKFFSETQEKTNKSEFISQSITGLTVEYSQTNTGKTNTTSEQFQTNNGTTISQEEPIQEYSPFSLEVLTGKEFALFLHDDRFKKEKFGRLECLNNDMGGLNELEECKKVGGYGFSTTCEEIEKELNEFIFPDYTFFYSGFTVSVLDLDKVVGHKTTLASGMKEFEKLDKYPDVLLGKILTTTTFRNWNTLEYIKTINTKHISKSDICKTFISLEGQDGYSPVINIVCKKGTKLISIYNNNRLLDGNYQRLNPDIEKLFSDFRNNESLPSYKENYNNYLEKVFEYYNNNIETNALYQNFKNEKIEKAFIWFAIK